MTRYAAAAPASRTIPKIRKNFLGSFGRQDRTVKRESRKKTMTPESGRTRRITRGPRSSQVVLLHPAHIVANRFILDSPVAVRLDHLANRDLHRFLRREAGRE